MTPRRPQPGGFTLLEMLVAGATAALVATTLYGSFYVAFRARQSAEADLEPIRAARLALEWVARDLQGALPPSGLLAAQFTGQDRTDSAGRPADVLSFYGTADGGQQFAGYGDLQQVIYSFEDEADLDSGASTLAALGVSLGGGAGASSSAGSTRLSSRSGMGMTAAGRAARRQDLGPSVQRQVLVRRTVHNLLAIDPVEPEPQVLCRNVVGFNLAYYDGSDPAFGWFDTWDSTGTQNTAPLAVEVTLDIELPAPANSAGQPIGEPTKYTLRRVIPLPCGQMASGEVTTSGGSTSGSTSGGTSGGSRTGGR